MTKAPFPQQFRILVLKSRIGEEWEGKFLFCGVALELYTVAQGETLEECRHNIERQLFCCQVIFNDKGGPLPGPAPEDYQRLRNSGDWHESVDPGWKHFCGRNEIVARWDIDLTKTKWRAVPRAGE